MMINGKKMKKGLKQVNTIYNNDAKIKVVFADIRVLLFAYNS